MKDEAQLLRVLLFQPQLQEQLKGGRARVERDVHMPVSQSHASLSLYWTHGNENFRAQSVAACLCMLDVLCSGEGYPSPLLTLFWTHGVCWWSRAKSCCMRAASMPSMRDCRSISQRAFLAHLTYSMLSDWESMGFIEGADDPVGGAREQVRKSLV